MFIIDYIVYQCYLYSYVYTYMYTLYKLSLDCYMILGSNANSFEDYSGAVDAYYSVSVLVLLPAQRQIAGKSTAKIFSFHHIRD